MLIATPRHRTTALASPHTEHHAGLCTITHSECLCMLGRCVRVRETSQQYRQAVWGAHQHAPSPPNNITTRKQACASKSPTDRTTPHHTKSHHTHRDALGQNLATATKVLARRRYRNGQAHAQSQAMVRGGEGDGVVCARNALPPYHPTPTTRTHPPPQDRRTLLTTSPPTERRDTVRLAIGACSSAAARRSVLV